MQGYDPELLKWIQPFYSHLVALCVTFTDAKASSETATIWFRSFAGTLLRVEGQAYFLTAGHILRNLYEGGNGVQICRARLVDSFGPNVISHEPIPFDLLNEPRFYIDKPEDGLDFGIIPLRENYTRLLEVNRLAFIDEQNFRDVPTDFDAYFMMGLPRELASLRVSESGTAEIEPVTISIQKKETLPFNMEMPAPLNPPFVGKIDPGFLQSIEGMSGGPIVGLKQGTPDRYWIVALQSAWYPGKREVIGCPLVVLFSFLKELRSAIE